MDIEIGVETREHGWFDPECRVTRDEDKNTANISGLGSKTGVFYRVLDFDEQIAPTAFDKTLREHPDVRGMFNHDPNYLLGRTKSKTMRVWVDDTGLRYDIEADTRQSHAQDVALMIERGDVDGSSIQFFVPRNKDSWDWEAQPRPKRTITEVQLIETGPVVLPASRHTSAKVQRQMTAAGIDLDFIEALCIKVRGGYQPAEQDAALVRKSIEILSRLVSLEPGEPLPAPAHSSSTPQPLSDEKARYLRSRAAHERRRLKILDFVA